MRVMGVLPPGLAALTSDLMIRMVGHPHIASSSRVRCFLLRFINSTVFEYQAFLAPCIRPREAAEATKTERKAVREIMATATQASICCQRNIQTSSKLPWNMRPETRTEAVMAMKRFKERKMPRKNFWRGLMRTAQRRRIGMRIIMISVPTSKMMSKMASPRERLK